METSREIVSLFYSDVSNKKRTGRGSFSRKGKGVRHNVSGGIKTAYDFLTTKERKKLNGDVKIMNVFTTLMTYMELQTHPEERQKEILTKWRETYKVNEIRQALGMDRNKYYELLYSLGVIERPDSSKPKNEKPSDTRGVYKPGANPENIMPFNDLKLLPKEKQLEILDSYNTNYNLRSVAAIWNKDVKYIYSLRYTLRNSIAKMKKNDPKIDVEENNQQVIEFHVNPREEKGSMTNNTGEKIIESEQQQERNDVQEVQETIMNAVKERDEQTGMNRTELEELKQLVYAQSALLDQIVKQQTENAAAAEPVVTESPKTDSETKPSGMNFSFADEKEGFLLHSDLERFISVLKKNPDQFKVEVKITRIED